MTQQSCQQLEVLAGRGGETGRHVLLGGYQQVHQTEELLRVLAALSSKDKNLLPSGHSQVSEEGWGWGGG